MDRVFSALASMTRRQILSYLNAGELTAGEIGDRFEFSSREHFARWIRRATRDDRSQWKLRLVLPLTASHAEFVRVEFEIFSVQRQHVRSSA